MYIILIGYLYVILMMALFEAFSPSGSVLGGITTFVIWGVLPTALLAYLLGAPARIRRKRLEEQAEHQQQQQATDSSQVMESADQTQASDTDSASEGSGSSSQ